jgi:hypothetical protein
MGGRLAFTYDINAGAEARAAGGALFAAGGGADVVATGVNVWHMSGAWKSPEEVLAQARAKSA